MSKARRDRIQIEDVLFAEGLGGFFYDDLAAIQAGAVRNGQQYSGRPSTSGFSAVRIPATVLRIGLRLSDGWLVWGDAMSVQYAGAAQRDPVFDPSTYGEDTRARLAGELRGAHAWDLVANLARAREATVAVGKVHRGLAYGLSQAFLAASAYARTSTMVESVCSSFGLPLIAKPVPIYSQSGEDRYDSVDKMIAKRVAVVPHGLINSMELFGPGGETFLSYVRWVRDRILSVADEAYSPILHFDVYGLPAKVFTKRTEMNEFFAKLETASRPFAVRLETPVIARSMDAQIEAMAWIRRDLRAAAIQVDLVADEWCNEMDDIRKFIAAGACDMIQIKMPDVGWLDDTVEAVALCRANDVKAFLGGSCTETDTSARYSVHIAIATQADQILAKPGMGVDEGLMIVANEQRATLEALRYGRASGAHSTDIGGM